MLWSLEFIVRLVAAAADRFARSGETGDERSEQQFAPVKKSQSIVKAARGSAIHSFVYICDLSSGESLGLISILLEAGEDLPNLLRLSQVGQGIGDGVVILEPEQRRELLLIQLVDADTDVVIKHEVQKACCLLFKRVLMKILALAKGG